VPPHFNWLWKSSCQAKHSFFIASHSWQPEYQEFAKKEKLSVAFLFVCYCHMSTRWNTGPPLLVLTFC
jgi:hypothetical protein